MKNQILKLSAVFFLFSNVLAAQDYENDEEKVINYAKNYSVSIIPTMLANSTVGIEGAYLYKKNKSIALQLLFIESQILLNFDDEDGFVREPNRRLFNGVAMNLNHRYFFGDFGFENGRSFIDAGLHFSSLNFNADLNQTVPDPNNPNQTITETIQEQYNTSRAGVNIIIGREIRMNENLFFDIFGGFIYRMAVSEPDFKTFSNSKQYPNSRWGFGYIGANFTIGAKFGIFFD